MYQSSSHGDKEADLSLAPVNHWLQALLEVHM